MRLIDANVLLKKFKALISAYRQIEGKHNWGDHCRIPAFEFMDALKNAKTIEAIPVDWIQSWWGKQGVPSLSHCLENTDEVIRTMLTDWVNENEND